MLDLSTLNNAQKEAVEYLNKPLLVLAGAGSGKTRVLTYRLANLLSKGVTNPWNIMAITFTRKAASEMRDRVNALLGDVSRGIWIGTFHHVCVCILRANASRIGFSDLFSIYDVDNTKRLVSSILDDLHINSKAFTPNSVRTKISAYKNCLLVPGKVEILTPIDDVAVKVYEQYQVRLRELNAMDFDDLLMYTYLLFKQNHDILTVYQERFTHILVDEYQDTNKAQFKIVAMLAAPQNNLMVVGDDDQSIYSWRGADITNILNFEKLYPNSKVVKLEQNYRSTKNILEAANNVIKYNIDRKPKKLFTNSEEGDKIGIYNASDNFDEGRWIASEIEKYNRRGIAYNNIAIFYRTNAQSRSLEDMLLRAGVPYVIVGGLKFFERAEIRNLLAYLSLIVNHADNVSCRRIINVPRRKIGKATTDLISEIAAEFKLSFFEACTLVLDSDKLKPKAKTALTKFVSIICDCQKINMLDISLRDKVDKILNKTGLLFALEAEATDEAKERAGNLKEFLGVVEEFEATHIKEDVMYQAPGEDTINTNQKPEILVAGNTLQDFVDWIQLRTDIDNTDLDNGAVSLMTIHAAKGLEFDYVFVAGMEDGLFPLFNAKLEHNEEEERRLAYVAITRARKKLYLTYAQRRKIYGDTQYNPPSPYITDIPQELRDNLGVGSFNFSGTGYEKRGDRCGISGSGKRSKVSYTSSNQNKIINNFFGNSISSEDYKDYEFVKGDQVIHKVFGEGVVVSIKKDIVKVKFYSSNLVKEFVLGFVPIKKVN